MKIKATFDKDGKCWVAWTVDVLGSMTQRKTLDRARANLIDTVL